MQAFIPFSLITFALFMLFGCSGSGSPTCTDDEVIALVKEIAKEPIGTRLIGKKAADEIKLNDKDAEILMLLTRYPNWGYKEWKDSMEQHEPMKKLLPVIDDQLADMRVNAIRTNEINEEIKKCSCGGQVAVDGLDPLPITYTGQYTEDGQIWVEVYGLQ